MHELTGDQKVVLRLLQETIHQLSQDQPKTRKRAMKTLGVTSENSFPAERDRIVEELQRALNRERPRKAPGTGFAAGFAGPAETAPEAEEEPWYHPRDRTVALFQSAMDEYLDERAAKEARATKKKGFAKQDTGKARKAHAAAAAKPAETIDLFFAEESTKRPGKAKAATAMALTVEQFSNLDPGWIEVVVAKIKLAFTGKAKFIVHKSITDFRNSLENTVKIALVGDWGGGNEAAKLVAHQIAAYSPDHVIHLGDVYYAGTNQEVKERFLALWPAGRLSSFALNSNHEMYTGGKAYFGTTLKKFGQTASYFSLGNKNVRFIGLDTGYVDHNLNKEQVDWLGAQLKTGPDKTILLSHHQLFSAFEGGDPVTDPGSASGAALEKWLKQFLDAGKIYAWFWGHEHRCLVYDSFKGTLARCVGHGCFPYNVPPDPPDYPDVPVKWVNRRKQDNGEGMHGFALLTIDGSSIHADYIDQDGTVSFNEDL
jgi:hypothetical protein